MAVIATVILRNAVTKDPIQAKIKLLRGFFSFDGFDKLTTGRLRIRITVCACFNFAIPQLCFLL